MHQRDALKETLKWLEELGHDEVIQSQSTNRYAPASPQPLTPQASSSKPLMPSSDIAPKQEDLCNINSLDSLKGYMENFQGCALKKTAMNLVFSDGTPSAKVMLIGEAPGADEDRQGQPFVGMSGQLLDTIFRAAGFSRENNLYIANILPWRPPGNRQPTTHEIALCLPMIKRHIELIAPDYLILAGSVSTKALLEQTAGITRIRGKWFDYKAGNKLIKAMPIYHPAFLLRSPSRKRDVWFDALTIKHAVYPTKG